jgi:hypothetical protein
MKQSDKLMADSMEHRGKCEKHKRQKIRSYLSRPLYYALCSVLLAVCFSAVAYADDSLDRMRDETMSYFKPLTGRILTVGDREVTVNLGTKDSVKPGMRLNILREEAPFRHPVTGEPLGRLEALMGKLVIKDIGADSSTGEIIEGSAKEGDTVRISEIPVDLLFCQSRDTDWYTADSYYRKLKETGRFNLIDTGVEPEDTAKVIEEAKRRHADVALLLTSQKKESGIVLTQRLLWVSDGVRFSETSAAVDSAYEKKLRSGDEFFKLGNEQAYLQLNLPIDAKLITIADVAGDGKREIVLSTGKDVMFFTLGADLHPALGGMKIVGSTRDDHLWLDSIDLNRNGRDEIIITSMKGDEVVSYVYELKDTEFNLLYKGDVFLRRLGDKLIAQEYSRAEGFSGDVFEIVWDGGYKKGKLLKLPKGINIYDFVYLEDPQKGRLLLAYDKGGFLNVYNEKNIRVWRSKTGTGGFLKTFKKEAPASTIDTEMLDTTMIDRGQWSVKDRLLLRNKDILMVDRTPLLEMMRGLGYKSSRIRSLWWNGLSIEESVLVDNISGTIFDYAIAGQKILFLASPIFGIKPGNILKGENPLRTELYIYTVKGI